MDLLVSHAIIDPDGSPAQLPCTKQRTASCFPAGCLLQPASRPASRAQGLEADTASTGGCHPSSEPWAMISADGAQERVGLHTTARSQSAILRTQQPTPPGSTGHCWASPVRSTALGDSKCGGQQVGDSKCKNESLSLRHFSYSWKDQAKIHKHRISDMEHFSQ